jgi:hypothetical protein
MKQAVKSFERAGSEAEGKDSKNTIPMPTNCLRHVDKWLEP